MKPSIRNVFLKTLQLCGNLIITINYKYGLNWKPRKVDIYLYSNYYWFVLNNVVHKLEAEQFCLFCKHSDIEKRCSKNHLEGMKKQVFVEAI